MNECALKLPTEDDKWLKFKNYAYKEPTPFVIYADLECLLEKQEDQGHGAYCRYQHHHAFSVGYYLHCRYDSSLSEYQTYRDEKGCITWFASKLYELSCKLQPVFDRTVPMAPLTAAQISTFRTATYCHVCEEPLGAYRDPAHSRCNLSYQSSYVIPVVFHNLSGYDAHFFIKELFLNSSLDKLSSYLDKSDLHIVRSQFNRLSNDDFHLLTRKGVFPYDYVSTYDKLSDTCLPPREAFYNQLCDSEISDVDYCHANEVWSRFGIQTLGQYSDLYLKLDVLLLADVFENFREKSLENYKLDPAHYYTLPGFAWDAMLKLTKIKLELFTDVDMLLFVERGIRGGLSQCSHRYARANNKYMSTYDSAEPSSYLMYFDVNNLYGWAMSQPLPHRGFQWVDDTSNFNIDSVPIDSPVGYILEVDLEYPQEIHDAHADLPFCPIHEVGALQKKLLTTLSHKNRYVLHYRYLQQCLRYNLKLKKIHRILKFEQSCWLRRYIDLNTRLRANANNDFSKNLFKLMNNAVFGKTMENVRNHVNVKLLSRWSGRYGAGRLIARPNFHSCTVFSEDFVAVQMNQLSIKFYKPIYIGMSVLDISKLHLNNVYGVSIANNKVLGLMKDENGGKIMTEFVGLRSKMYAIRVQDKDDYHRVN
ncbi:uncharacterized protein LOC143261204 [Megalopta genalis]|uniref:uncharacterized protein LOC143260287 n=1 Tax=Megalopta genalis TaxID=115081 RepID=UPI003FCFD218